ncbi:MAG: hypothetical protein NBV67_10300 [Tagaea sp.]|nr:hypothetical protein [Tagaea sp.]
MIGEALVALHGSGLAQFARGSTWFYPAMAALHLVGAATLFGAIALLDLRLMGVARGLAIDALEPLAVRMALGGAALCVVSGVPMFAAGAVGLAANPAFLLKMLCVAAAGANAASYRARRGAPAPHGAVSLGCWIVVLIAGSLAAYV